MEPSLFKFIIRHSYAEQLKLVILTGCAFPFLYLSLELPKHIINEAIGGGAGFPVILPLIGIELAQIPYLLALSGFFLALVLINGGFKYAINVYAGSVGERMLKRLRAVLFRDALELPLSRFRHVGQGEIVAMLVAETEPVAGFIGDSIKLPLFQGGTLITIIIFMFAQDWVLGIAAVSLYPVQAWIIPVLQRRLNRLRREIVVGKRSLSERVGEVVNSVQEIRAHDSGAYEAEKFARDLDTLFGIRVGIFKRKYFIKFLNNFLAQVTPFLFYALGGYLVIVGELSFGALVAVLAAYKDLNSPWKELLNYYQVKEDARIKYELLVETFEPERESKANSADRFGLERESVLGASLVSSSEGTLVATRLNLSEPDQSSAEDGYDTVASTFRIGLDKPAAIYGRSPSDTQRLGLVMAGLERPALGYVTIDGNNVHALANDTRGRRIGYVGPDTRLRSGTLLENLLLPLRRAPSSRSKESLGGRPGNQETATRTAQESRGAPDGIDSDWIDFAACGATDWASLIAKIIEALTVADLGEDVYRWGLQGTADPQTQPGLVAKVLEARSDLRERVASPEFRSLVQPFDRHHYNTNMSVAENLLFGTPLTDEFNLDGLAGSPYVRKVLHETGLMQRFLEIGHQIAELMIDLFADVSPESELFVQYSFIRAHDLPEYRTLLSRADPAHLDLLSPEDKRLLLRLPFRLVPARHRLGLVDASLRKAILHARGVFARGFGQGPPAVEFFDAARYNGRGSIQDNILFGRLVYGRPRGGALIGAAIREVVERKGLNSEITQSGLQYAVGVSGARLSGVQKQKVAIARTWLKRPDVFILDQATSVFDARSAERIVGNLLSRGQPGLIWLLPHAKVDGEFGTTLVFENGRVIEEGQFVELYRPGTALFEMLTER